MGRGDETRAAILDRALQMARAAGLHGVTIGALAEELDMSKSGLFAHFGSKETLQLEVLELAASRFTEAVFAPALKAPRGIPRLRAIFERWLEWERQPGGCPFVIAAVELDDRPGPVRDALVRSQRQLLDGLRRAVEIAIAEGQLRPDVDVEQLAYELHGLLLAYHYDARLLRDERADARARKAFDGLVERARPR